MGGRGFNPLLLGPLIRLLFSKTGLIIIGILLVLAFVTGTNPLNFILGGGSQGVTSAPYEQTAEENEMVDFSSVVLVST
mgnify:CR=1 FL=1